MKVSCDIGSDSGIFIYNNENRRQNQMYEFILENEHHISATFHSPEINDTGWVQQYALTLTSQNMNATIHVDNPPFGTSPESLFNQLSLEWKGWKGEKCWTAIKGECSITATSNLTGHVELTFELHPISLAPCWSSTVTLILQAGQLERIANNAKAFFHPNEMK